MGPRETWLGLAGAAGLTVAVLAAQLALTDASSAPMGPGSRGAIAIGATLFATPMALAFALTLAEQSSSRARQRVARALMLLAGLPATTWVFLFAPGGGAGTTSAVQGAAAGLLVAASAVRALESVPDAIREAAEALGASPAQVVSRVVLPACRGALVVAVGFGLVRSVGEALIVHRTGLGLTSASLVAVLAVATAAIASRVSRVTMP